MANFNVITIAILFIPTFHFCYLVLDIPISQMRKLIPDGEVSSMRSEEQAAVQTTHLDEAVIFSECVCVIPILIAQEETHTFIIYPLSGFLLGVS